VTRRRVGESGQICGPLLGGSVSSRNRRVRLTRREPALEVAYVLTIENGCAPQKYRPGYHARASAWLAGLTGDRAPERLGAAAEHYARAGDNANACRSFVQAAGTWAVRWAKRAPLTGKTSAGR